MKNIIITGASGFIGHKLCQEMSRFYRVIAFDNKMRDAKLDTDNYTFFEGDITNQDAVLKACQIYKPDIIVHCAGIAHQKFNSHLGAKDYDDVNHRASKKIAQIAVDENPNVHFIFLSSISVYGENSKGLPVSEKDRCNPSTPYACSKFDAEDSLIEMYNKKKLKKLEILRLAPVYDHGWSFNLEKRVFGPRKLCYLKFGSGEQKMSALSRATLIDFIKNRIENSSPHSCCEIYNITDKTEYSFNQIISVFKRSTFQPNRFVIKVPLPFVKIATTVSSTIFTAKSEWIRSCYDKVAFDLIFDNTKMLDTGFVPRQTLESVFLRKI